jgi:DNA-directed RNA polymerase subunit K/omega
MKLLEDYNDIRASYNPSKNITRNVLTKYELTKLIGMRIEQLARGAPTLIEIDKKKNLSIHDIVYLELDQKKLPLMIVRNLPTGQKEYWRLVDMIIPKYSKASSS